MRRRSRLSRLVTGALSLVAGALLAGGLVGCCAFSAKGHRGPRSDHFDGTRFVNQVPNPEERGFSDVLAWMLDGEPGGAFPAWTEVPRGSKPPERVGKRELRVTFVGHATVLVQQDGVNLLTDPVWSDRVGPLAGTGPSRRRAPGLRFEDLPPIDVVVVSHSHYDHLDLPTLTRLAEEHDPLFVAGLGTRELLAEAGITRATDLDWWQSVPLGEGVRVHAVPARHFSMRGVCDRDKVLWAGYVLEGPAGATYFAGDTGFGPHFAEIRERFGPVRLALLPIGAYLPRWFMAPVHIDPAEAVEAHRVLEASISVAIHHRTFDQADEADGQPETDLARALAATSLDPARFWPLLEGEGREVPPVAPPSAAAAEGPRR